MKWFSTTDEWLSRWLFERVLALTYVLAFAVVINQFRPLLGEHGLLPVPSYLRRVSFRKAPSLFHARYSDRLVTVVGWIGLAIGASLLVGLPQAAPLGVSLAAWFVLWALYLSVINVGQTFYSFGWETLLVEAGFLAMFLGNSATPPPAGIMWLLRFLLFRLEFGAGLIKMRGDRCWRDLTCLDYHHETQPMPNPLSRYFHLLPKRLHRIETFSNHVAQLVVPWFLFAPQPVATIAALIIAITQAWLMFSGNFSWLNFVTIGLALSVIDERVLEAVLPIDPRHTAAGPAWHAALVWVVTGVVVVLGWFPVRNMISKRQAMNASFNSLRLVNTYGAFGSVTRTRYEIVIEGTDDLDPGPTTEWREYEFKGKPGDVRRRPRQFAPYHLRLDWLMWFAALSSSYAQGWFDALMRKLLANDPATLRLLRSNPFPDHPPAFLRARRYEYRFATRQQHKDTGVWWVRTFANDFVRPVRRR